MKAMAKEDKRPMAVPSQKIHLETDENCLSKLLARCSRPMIGKRAKKAQRKRPQTTTNRGRKKLQTNAISVLVELVLSCV